MISILSFLFSSLCPGREVRVPGHIQYIWSARRMPLSVYHLFQCDAMRPEASSFPLPPHLSRPFTAARPPPLHEAPFRGGKIFFASRLLDGYNNPAHPFWNLAVSYLSVLVIFPSTRFLAVTLPFSHTPALFLRSFTISLSSGIGNFPSLVSIGHRAGQQRPDLPEIRRRWACPPEDSSSRSSGRAGPVSKARYS